MIAEDNEEEQRTIRSKVGKLAAGLVLVAGVSSVGRLGYEVLKQRDLVNTSHLPLKENADKNYTIDPGSEAVYYTDQGLKWMRCKPEELTRKSAAEQLGIPESKVEDDTKLFTLVIVRPAKDFAKIIAQKILEAPENDLPNTPKYVPIEEEEEISITYGKFKKIDKHPDLKRLVNACLLKANPEEKPLDEILKIAASQRLLAHHYESAQQRPIYGTLESMPRQFFPRITEEGRKLLRSEFPIKSKDTSQPYASRVGTPSPPGTIPTR